MARTPDEKAAAHREANKRYYERNRKRLQEKSRINMAQRRSTIPDTTSSNLVAQIPSPNPFVTTSPDAEGANTTSLPGLVDYESDADHKSYDTGSLLITADDAYSSDIDAGHEMDMVDAQPDHANHVPSVAALESHHGAHGNESPTHTQAQIAGPISLETMQRMYEAGTFPDAPERGPRPLTEAEYMEFRARDFQYWDDLWDLWTFTLEMHEEERDEAEVEALLVDDDM